MDYTTKEAARAAWDRANSSKIAANALYQVLVDGGHLSPAARLAAREVLNRWDDIEAAAWEEYQKVSPSYEVTMLADLEGSEILIQAPAA